MEYMIVLNMALEELIAVIFREGLCIEEKAVTTLAHLCDGDARVALNSLESAIESARATNCSIVGVEDVKEGLQRSHIQYDRAG